MCHIVLLMPVFGLAVFWLWPLSVALPVYTVIAVLSGFIYFALLRAMHQPVRTGKEGLIGEVVETTAKLNPEGEVRVHGEIWKAVSPDKMKKGDMAKVIDIDGMTLKVRRLSPGVSELKEGHHCSIRE